MAWPAETAGRYRVTAWIPPNFLASGAMSVSAAVYSLTPRVEHFREVDAVISGYRHSGAGTARGDFTSYIAATTRPKLEWKPVQFEGSRRRHQTSKPAPRFGSR